MGRLRSTYVKMNKSYNFLVVKPKEKMSLGKSRRKWKDNMEWMLRRYAQGMLTRFMWISKGDDGGISLLSHKRHGIFLTSLGDYPILKMSLTHVHN
jgi:hypothetical protein